MGLGLWLELGLGLGLGLLDGAGADLLYREEEDEDDRRDDHCQEAEGEDGGVHGEAILERLGHDTRHGVGQALVLEEGRGRLGVSGQSSG